MVQQLAPISSKITDVSNIVESHLFERGGKFWSFSEIPVVAALEPLDIHVVFVGKI